MPPPDPPSHPRTRSHKVGPLYSARKRLHTGADLLTSKQKDRFVALFATDAHVEVEATWGIYLRMIATYRETDRTKGRALMTALIESVSSGVPTARTEVITLGRTLKKRAANVLAYFDRPGTSNGPTEVINGRFEPSRGSELTFPRPHQLHRQEPARDGRLSTTATSWILKSH